MKTTMIKTMICLAAVAGASAASCFGGPISDAQAKDAEEAYLFAYFSDRGHGGRRGEAAGMRLAYSYDGLTWTALADEKPFLVPNVGKAKLMRDPSICRGPDGTFHLVWTTGWGERVIGHASSRNLVDWSEQQEIPVMAHEPTARNCWAPEVTYNPDDGLFYVYWATTIPGRHSGDGKNEKGASNHRIYLTTTKDWKSFTPTRLWFNPEFSAIDAALLRTDGIAGAPHRWLMAVKNENGNAKNIRLVWTDSLSEPWEGKTILPPVTGDWVEGPSVLKLKDSIVIYFDCYTKHRYGAVKSTDGGKTWRDVSGEVSFPKGIRHGTAFAVPAALLNKLKNPRTEDCRGNGRQVGLFYFLWLGEHGRKGPYDVTKILEADPKAGDKPDSPLWGPWGSYHHWGESLYGYYFSDDEWVVRRHMKLIMQAGIDFLFFDTTNARIYERNAKLVMRVLQEYHDAGWRIPKVMFYTNTASGKTVRRIYDAVYKPGFAKDTWYSLDGRPVIVAKEEECDAETKAFFTIVKSQWPNERAKKGGWPWMDFTRPQRVFAGEKVAKSVMNVSVAQHPTCRFGDSVMYGEKGNRGRAFHNGANDPTPGAWTKGYNFQEQWNRAHEAKPDIVLVTGWNEWIAGRWRRKDRPDRPVMFVDCANAEYSRDIEMMRGGYGDNFFLMLRDNVRRFKGLVDDGAANPPNIPKRYRCFADSGMPRNHAGYGTNYVNRTQRNVPEWIEVSHDKAGVTFRVKTQKPVVGKEGEGDYMRILVNGNAVNELGEMKVSGDLMTLTVPRRALGLKNGDFRFGFKFVDSTVVCRNALDWYEYGVVEPLGRVEFIYSGRD